LRNRPDLVAKFNASGITTFNQYGSDESVDHALMNLTGELDNPKNLWESVGYYTRKFGMKLEDMSSFVEAATRMGEFQLALEQGSSVEDAAMDARDVTLDFSRHGKFGKKINRYIPFFNAALQGGDKMVRLLKEKPVETAMALAKYIIIPTIGLWAMNHDEDWYKDLDPEVKYSNWVLPGGIRIPKPQEAGITFGSGMEAMLNSIVDKDPRAGKNLVAELQSSLAPNFIPTIALPIIEWMSNYSFFRGQALVGKRYQSLPDELQYNQNTTEFSKALGRTLNLSPIKIDNVVRNYTGTMGMFLLQAPDYAFEEKRNLPARNLNERTFIRDFNVTDSTQNRYLTEFYELQDAATKQKNGYNKDSKAAQEINGFGRTIAKLRSEIRTITDNKRITPEKKRELINIRNERIRKIAKRAVEKYGSKYDY
jgi:hypothetical protein